ncbi:MAG: 6,7-dimethyl-8-ribityllumazine synthase [Desulfomicrobium sp.]|jgi:6,7-dimethyl-8-ribityllumazine synthase|nr:6,7-dimethyl-8-ribityllumazine synthase [Desulfomicrobium sp.]NLV96258.1 6,7-dimethyl-8-ribityllumazine synthase [Desulfovibrionales bacterium]
MLHVKTIEGQLQARNLKFTLIASRFNDFIVDRLIGGAVDYLVRHEARREDITLIRVPGAFEMPLVAQKVARSGQADAIICVGAVIRGATPHFDYVCSEATKGIAHVSLETGVPIGFGLLTTDTLEQSIERAGSKAGNKGVEAAAAALETLRVLQQL